MKTLLLTFSLFLVLHSSDINAKWHSKVFNVMGTQAKVEFWEPDPDKGKQLVQDVVDEMNRIDQLMSPYIESSELFRINKKASHHPVKVSAELYDLIARSIKYSEMTQGAFDITFVSVGYRYNYREQQAPSKSFINKAKSLIDYHAIQLDPEARTVAFKKEGTRIDLGGIAKGHAVDTSINILKSNGISNAFIKAGGDSRLLGDKRGRLWTIGIQHPRKEGDVLTQVPLENVAISTSGDYERFFIRDGERIHHILDPKTGLSSKESISVSIIANDATTADALSTSVFVMGPERGLELINQLEDVSAIIVDKKGKFHYSRDLSAQ